MIDDGVQLDHPDLNVFTNAGEIPGNSMDNDGNGWVDDVHGWNFVNNTNSSGPLEDSDNHGTAVAGVAAARGENSLGVTGSSQQSQVLPVKIFRGAQVASDANIAEAIYYAAGRTVNGQGTWPAGTILNASWGGGTPNTATTDAFAWATSSGRGGLGAPAFVSSGNNAAGIPEDPGYRTYTLNGIPAGNWTFEWRYMKDDIVSSGDDTAWLANVHFPNGQVERFDATGLPPNWTTSGNANWSVVDDPAHSFGTGRYVAKAGTITHNQVTRIRSPQITVTVTSSLTYSAWVSSEQDYDFLRFYYSTNGGQSFTEATGLAYSGVPTIVSNVAYPANLATVVAVGAGTDWDYRSDYSQYGAALDVVAPSDGGFAGITTTDRTGSNGYNNATGTAGDYTSTAASAFGGTSSAAPLTAGVAALMLSKNPNLTAAQIRSIVTGTADKIGGNNGQALYTNGFNQYYGYGRVNAYSSVEAVYPDTTAPVVLSVTPAHGTTTNAASPIFVDVEFSEPVVGVDTTDLLVYGAGATVTANGSHNFYVKAVDVAGNFSQTPGSQSFTIDTHGPRVMGVTMWNTYSVNAQYPIPAVEDHWNQLLLVQVGGGINLIGVPQRSSQRMSESRCSQALAA